jgi:hypothetical protein
MRFITQHKPHLGTTAFVRHRPSLIEVMTCELPTHYFDAILSEQ